MFAFVTCRFEPWDSECQVFANHLIENDIRGTMTFGDKATRHPRLADGSTKRIIPEEGRLSQRRFADCLAAAGYRVPRA